MTPAQRYETYRYALRDVSKPCAFVDLDRLRHNAELVREYTGGRRVRLGSKSLRCVSVMSRLLGDHEPFEGLLCYTASEAAWLTTQGFDDLVVAYPTWDAPQLGRVARCVAEGSVITLMADCEAHLERYAEVAREVGVVLRVCLDLDMGTRHLGLHFGALRTTLRTEEAVLALCERVESDANLTLDGLMGYEGQIAGTADAVPGEGVMNAVKRGLKAMSAPRVVARRARLVEAVRGAGHAPRFVNAGGSGSLRLNASEDAITEVTAGSAFYAPVLFGHHRDYGYLPAAGYAVEVVRRPARGVFTCLGGGYPASGAPGPSSAPVPWLPEGAALTPFEGAGEVQTPVRYDGPVALGLGSPVFMRHAKAGELCERFVELHLIEDGVLVDVVPTYRGQGQCFL